MNRHPLNDCFGVWYNHWVEDKDFEHLDEICDQGFADFYLDGINKAEAKLAKKRK